MSTKSHITSLQRRHSALHDEIEDLQKSPAPDSLELLRLKREKLQLKDQISSLAA
jgi:hypothetical protein